VVLNRTANIAGMEVGVGQTIPNIGRPRKSFCIETENGDRLREKLVLHQPIAKIVDVDYSPRRTHLVSEREGGPESTRNTVLSRRSKRNNAIAIASGGGVP